MAHEQSFLELIEAWDGSGVVVKHDELTGSWIFIALHDDTLGPMVGGCRMKTYACPEDGLRDAMRLARGMTHKWAALDLPCGGGKSVLAIPGPLSGADRRGLLHRFGELLNTLDGAYGTGEDLGTTPEDMRVVADVSKHVVGIHGIEGAPSDPGPFTARGVFAGIRSALRHRHGTDSLSDRTVLVQGVGDVGGPVSAHDLQGRRHGAPVRSRPKPHVRGFRRDRWQRGDPGQRVPDRVRRVCALRRRRDPQSGHHTEFALRHGGGLSQ
ncbi:MAG TPA: hypothetical protein DC060_18935 [Gemmatimonadetes bacterium]|nr:hypothetical protein [Gemmatimonadota bacterium]